jgi:hypothetical protein
MKSRNLPLVLGIAAVASSSLSLSVRAQSFTFTDFSNPTGLTLNGNATAPTPDAYAGGVKALQLTPALGGQAGSAFSTTPVQLGNSASFSTAFSFQLSNGGGINDGNSPPNPLGADGLVFVLNTQSNSVGSSGQGVGYQGIANSVGIKFDTWQDSAGFPQDQDPNGNFVAIYTDGSTLYDPSAAPGSGPANTYYTPSTSMKNGDIWYAWIDYNGSTDLLSVSLSDGVDVRPSTANLSETIDLNASSILGQSPNVFAGFTAGTGGAWDQTDVLNWQFNDNYQPINQVGNGVPDSGPGMPLVAGVLAALGACASVRVRRAA